MFKEKVFLIITIIFSIICCVWFFKLTVEAQKRSSILDESSTNRANNARASKSQDILVGVVANSNASNPDHIVNAVKMAAKEINDSGFIGKRKIKLIIRNDQGKVDEARTIAQSFADNLDVSYVIGHLNSTIAVKVQPIYEFYGILFFTPTASTPSLSRNGAKYFFRNYPNDKRIGKFISEFCQFNGWKQIAVVYPNNVYGKGVKNSIESSSDINDVEIIARYSFDLFRTDFVKPVMELKKYHTFDAVVGIFDHEDPGKEFINAAIDVGLDVPIILTPDLAELDFGNITSKYPEVIYVLDVKPSLKEPSKLTAKFVDDFKKEYNENPSFIAYNSYDALWAIANAIHENKFAAKDVAAYLHNNKSIEGVAGINTYDGNGDTDKQINVDHYLPQK